MKIGDFVTAYGSGYQQLIDIKPKIAFDDYKSETLSWKKGDRLGEWVILKKAFTNKMKPRIYFSYEDSRWLNPVSPEISNAIEQYFSEHPEYKQKFDNAEVKLLPSILNCWIDFPEEKEQDFRETLKKLPLKFTTDELWKIAAPFKKYVSKPPAKYLLNLYFYPWDMNENATLCCSGWELIKD